ncbi:MAG: hypothetical protein RIQ94_741 [Pseudomonadota bacterium]|jgi:hypothetical protein
MTLPPLLHYDSTLKYKTHYDSHYCRGNIVTFDGIRVYFKPQKFGHAFYQNSQRRNGAKDEFSFERAQRMDWIKLTLEHPDAELFIGWNKDKNCYEESRRVSVVYGDFVVVIEMGLNNACVLKANFITCYVADKSIAKIKNSPLWSKDKCLKRLQK